MARYTYRFVEVKVNDYVGSANSFKDEFLNNAKDGEVWCIWNNETKYRYFRKQGDEWIGLDKCPSHWVYCKALSERKKPVIESDKYPEYYTNPWKSLTKMTDENGNERYFDTMCFFCNNGGAIRDEYLNDWNSSGRSFANRGLPDDCSEELIAELKKDDEDLSMYKYTHVYLKEWYDLYDKEEKRIFGLLKDAYMKEVSSRLEKKVDYMLAHMKDPMSITKEDIEKLNEKDEDDENSYYESPECVIEENAYMLYHIAEEIGKIHIISDDMYDIYNEDHIRVIYYVC